MALLDEEDKYIMRPAWTEKQVVGGNGSIPKWTLNLLYELHIAEAETEKSLRNSDNICL